LTYRARWWNRKRAFDSDLRLMNAGAKPRLSFVGRVACPCPRVMGRYNPPVGTGAGLSGVGIWESGDPSGVDGLPGSVQGALRATPLPRPLGDLCVIAKEGRGSP